MKRCMDPEVVETYLTVLPQLLVVWGKECWPVAHSSAQHSQLVPRSSQSQTHRTPVDDLHYSIGAGEHFKASQGAAASRIK